MIRKSKIYKFVCFILTICMVWAVVPVGAIGEGSISDLSEIAVLPCYVDFIAIDEDLNGNIFIENSSYDLIEIVPVEDWYFGNGFVDIEPFVTNQTRYEVEPNDTYAQARTNNIFQPNMNNRGWISTANDIDIFAITPQFTGTITFNMFPPSGVTATLHVRDSVTNVQVASPQNAMLPGTARTINMSVISGRRYYVRIASGNGTFSATHPYNMHIIAVPVTSITVFYPRATVGVGETLQRQTRVDVLPSNASIQGANQRPTFVSETPNIATVDANGNIRGVRPGTAIIRAYAQQVSSASPAAVHRFSVMVGFQNMFRPIGTSNHISSHWGWRIHPIRGVLHFHNGIDVPMPADTRLYAVAAGEVAFIGHEPCTQTGRGHFVVIETDQRGNTAVPLRAVYVHLIRRTPRNIRDRVATSTLVGNVGTTGASNGNHLHFTVITDGGNQGDQHNTINPVPLFPAGTFH